MKSNLSELPGQLVERFDDVELPAKPAVDDIVWAVRRILAKPYIQSITINAGQPIRVVWKCLEGDTLDFDLPEPSPADVVRMVELEPLDLEGPAAQQLGEAVLMVERQGLSVSHVVVGPKSLLRQWLGVPIDPNAVNPTPLRRVMGGLVVTEDTYPEEMLILVGSPSSASPLGDAVVAYQLFMGAE